MEKDEVKPDEFYKIDSNYSNEAELNDNNEFEFKESNEFEFELNESYETESNKRNEIESIYEYRFNYLKNKNEILSESILSKNDIFNNVDLNNLTQFKKFKKFTQSSVQFYDGLSTSFCTNFLSKHTKNSFFGKEINLFTNDLHGDDEFYENHEENDSVFLQLFSDDNYIFSGCILDSTLKIKFKDSNFNNFKFNSKDVYSVIETNGNNYDSNNDEYDDYGNYF
jgi:hypothetical protein